MKPKYQQPFALDLLFSDDDADDGTLLTGKSGIERTRTTGFFLFSSADAETSPSLFSNSGPTLGSATASC
jgi:hypothetical protein